MERDLKRTIGLRVRAARQQKGLSQETLAERIGRTTETVSNIERGKTLATISTLEELSAQLGVPIREFFAEERAARDPARLRQEFRLRELVSDLSDAALKIVVEHAVLLAEYEENAQPRRRAPK